MTKSVETMPGVTRETVEYGDGRQAAQIIHCSTCRAVEVAHPTAGFYAPDHLRKIFIEKGWRVDKKARHRCPTCLKEKDMSAAPRVMQLPDRQKINRRLMEVYDDKRQRYCDDFTDQSIGKELGLPWAWVETVRSENYGPAGSNVEMERVASAIGSLHADAKRFTDEAMALAARGEDLAQKAVDLRGRLDAIETAVGPQAAR